MTNTTLSRRNFSKLVGGGAAYAAFGSVALADLHEAMDVIHAVALWICRHRRLIGIVEPVDDRRPFSRFLDPALQRARRTSSVLSFKR